MPKAKRRTPAPARKARRRQRSRNRRATEVALAALAHDIRTPLTGIVAIADLLHASNLPERERRWAAAIKSAADHLTRLTTVVVDAVKANAAGLVLHPQPFSPRELAQAVAGSLAAVAEGKGLDVEVSIADDLPVGVIGDALRLRSALENLIDNAVKFTEHGRVAFSVSAARAGRGRVKLIFTVSDSGIGIAASDLKQLFRPFAQASESVARRFGGAGLGLVFVKRIAQAMGGTLTVASKPGRGSTFRLAVPAKAGEVPVGKDEMHAAFASSLRVLCVEDNPYGRVVLKTMLSELGHHVRFVDSGEAAVEFVARGGHDVVLMDIVLSGIDGIEAARRIRALPAPAGQIPIIGVSGRAEAGDEAAARAAGMDEYLRKPVGPAALNEALRSASRVKRA
jgi:CheY-like chemotaxis protein/nitrogen-specific signal transduction histidine kinase